MKLSARPDAHVSVRWLRTERFDDAVVAARAWADLGRDERTALARMRPGPARRDRLAAHALARTMLAERAQCHPSEVALRKSRLGRPVFVPPPGAAGASVSIGARRGLVVCAVANGGLVGADVECLDSVGADPIAVAAQVCSATELCRLLSLPARERRRWFLRLWTLKEAVLKATGRGLTVPPESVTVDPELRFGPALSDDPARWRLVTAWPTPRHATAVAVRTRSPRRRPET